MLNSRACTVALAALTTLLLLSANSFAQEAWPGRADVLAAGAAASIVAFHLCEGDSRPAGERAHQKLSQQAQLLASSARADLREVQQYLADSTNRKVRALWQANQDRSCAQLGNLRQMAAGTGFDTPTAP